MTQPRQRQIFVNLAVRDLKKSMDFFGALGLSFNPQFTDDKAACMVINTDAYVMLITEPFFRTFTKREPCDTKTHTEALIALSCESKAAVDEIVRKAIDAGGAHAMDATDHGFMYAWSFYDIDGHHWEVMWMDPNAAQ